MWIDRQFSRLRIRKKISYGYALSIGMAIIGYGSGKILENTYQNRAIKQLDQSLEITTTLTNLQGAVLQSHIQAPRLIALSTDPLRLDLEYTRFLEYITAVNRLVKETKSLLDTADSNVDLSNQDIVRLKQSLQAYIASLKDYSQKYQEIPRVTTPSNSSADAIRESLPSNTIAKISEVDNKINVVVLEISNLVQDIEKAQSQKTLQTFDKAQKIGNLTTIASLLLSATIALILANYTSRAIAHPLEITTKVAQKVTQDANFTLQAPVTTRDEVGQLATSFNQLIQKVAQYTEDLMKAQQAANAANVAKSEFLASMSHELRTPLNGILGYVQILMRSPNITEIELKSLEIIQQCGSHLLTLINDILDLSKIEARKLELHPNEFHFLAFLQMACEICQIKAESKKISFISQFDTELPVSVQADEKRLRQVLLNLLGNAVKFTDIGSVTFKVGVLESSIIKPTTNSLNNVKKIRFQIEDTGVGISQEQMQKIFTPFEQVGETKRMTEGTGLGLAISSKIVQEMGSNIRVASQLGVGSQFWFDLDLSCASEFTLKPTFELKRTIVGFTGNKRKLLVIDDRWENRSLIVNLLTPVGFEVFEATNGNEGLEKVNELKPDAIITDLVMPVIDGFELLRRLRNSQQFKDIVIIVSSASVFETDQYQSLKAGANAFLPKPVQVSELFELLQKQLGLFWLYAELPASQPNSGSTATISSLSQPTSTPTPTISSVESLVIPPPEIIEVLYDFAKKGHLKAIIQKTEELKKLDEQWIPFADRLRDMAASFEEKQLQAFILQYKSQ